MHRKPLHTPRQHNPFLLVILDGFGYNSSTAYQTMLQTTMPHYTAWQQQYPHTLLHASGAAVGLPEHILSNSEVGHMILGAGKIVPQAASIIHEVATHNKLADNQVLNKALTTLCHIQGNLHIIGLLSDAGVHSLQSLLYALLDVSKTYPIKQIYIHPILDGRDTPPESAATYLKRLEQYIHNKPNMRIGSVHGRFYAMDRDNNKERTDQSATCLTHKQSQKFDTWQQILEYYYHKQIPDEFIVPTQLDQHSIIVRGDGIIFFNFRADRAQQLTQALINAVPDLAFFITPFKLPDPTITTISLFDTPIVKDTLLEILNAQGVRIFTIAETEKYAHVTYFFKGGGNIDLEHETRVLIPSLKERTYVKYPEMSAPAITQSILDSLNNNPCDFYLINYANADMVGHSGNAQAVKAAFTCLDQQLFTLYQQVVLHMQGTMLITADHGNAESLFDTNAIPPHTSHTNNQVPFLIMNQKWQNKDIPLPLTTLADITPYILHLLKISIV